MNGSFKFGTLVAATRMRNENETEKKVRMKKARFDQPTISLPWNSFQKLHLRSDLHLARKAWHFGMGLFIVGVYVLTGISRTTGVITLGIALAICLLIEWMRLKFPSMNARTVRLWGPLMRESEVNQVSTTPFYIGAALLSVAIFPQSIACLAILYLAIGDPIASIFGILFGHKSVRFSNGKSLIGTTAGVTACFLTTWFFAPIFGVQDFGLLWILSLVGGLSGGAAELLPLEVDDNFSIPVVSGFVLWFVHIFLGLV